MRDLPCFALLRHRQSMFIHRPWCSLPLLAQKSIAATCIAQAPTSTGPPLPLLLLHRLPCLTVRAPPRSHVGTTSSTVNWPSRALRACLTMPTGTTGTRRSARPWHGALLQTVEEVAPGYIACCKSIFQVAQMFQRYVVSVSYGC
jgi:hypothetical protein